jgi:hypothetical protein
LWKDGIRHLMDKGVEETFSRKKIGELLEYVLICR